MNEKQYTLTTKSIIGISVSWGIACWIITILIFHNSNAYEIDSAFWLYGIAQISSIPGTFVMFIFMFLEDYLEWFNFFIYIGLMYSTSLLVQIVVFYYVGNLIAWLCLNKYRKEVSETTKEPSK